MSMHETVEAIAIMIDRLQRTYQKMIEIMPPSQARDAYREVISRVIKSAALTATAIQTISVVPYARL